MKITTLLLSTSLLAFPLSVVPLTNLEKAEKADAVIVAKLVKSEVILDKESSLPITELTFQTSESWKGEAPKYFKCSCEGGVTKNLISLDERFPEVALNGEYLLYLKEHPQGYLSFVNYRYGVQKYNSNAHQKALNDSTEFEKQTKSMQTAFSFERFTVDDDEAETTAKEVTSNGLSGVTSLNAPKRYIEQDSGVGIPVIADVSTLPAGLSESAALSALQNALDAWEEETSILFDFQGTEVFSQSASEFLPTEGIIIRIQFHDNFNVIDNNSTTLGIGGSGVSIIPRADGSLIVGEGGNVDGLDTFRTANGFVVLEHTRNNLADPLNLENVLCHEIGHVIGLAHSSENNNETDQSLTEAIMYFRADFAQRRGADLRAYDIDTAEQLYPENTPPVSQNEFLRVVTAFTPLQNPQVNTVNLDVFDLQDDTSNFNFIETDRNELNGVFSVNGRQVTYTANGAFGDSGPLFDFDNGQSAGEFIRGYFSDGTNRSPLIQVGVLEFFFDSQPAGSPDGIPDSWMTSFFGSTNGSTFSTDADGDGLTNYQEFRLNTDPTDSQSGLPEIQTDPENGRIILENNPFAVFKITKSEDLSPNSFETELPVKVNRSTGSTQFGRVINTETDDAAFYRVEYSAPE